jgi:basic membrane lipoprotein Med (substrate-binding protein (PBP1-ABC) superfamily)
MMRSRAAAAPTESALNPFKGLQPFQEADADHFYGRDRLVGEVIRRIADQTLVTLVGPSGSGKSSVARAGVIPALLKDAIPGSDRWLIAQMVPGSRPLAELEAALLRSTIDAPDSLADQLDGDKADILRAALRVLPDDTAKILIVIDQFEELFTLVDDEETRTRFLEGLTEAVNEPHGRVRVLLTLRADFYDRPLHYPTFGARMGDGVVNVVPMAPDELEQAAEEPAARAGVSIAPSLLASLLTDVVGQPGALPLFQYTLTELFDRRAGAKLDLETYEAMGGLRGALTRRADDLFSELSEQQRAAARQLLLRLVTIAETDEWSRRRIAASEIVALDVDIVDLKAVIDAYGGARLLTFDRDHVSGSPTVEVAHEALLTEWERLREWIDEARDDIRIQARLAAAGTEWRSSGENPDYLLRGSRLDEFEAWAGLTTLSLTVGEHGFLDASVAEREAIATVEEERFAREVAMGRRAKRRLWGLAAVVPVLAGIGIALLLLALAPDPPTVALVGVQRGDPFGDQIVNGFEQAARENDFDAVHLVPTSDPGGELTDLLETGPDVVIISGFGMEQFFGVGPDELAARYPDTLFVMLDAFIEEAPNTVAVTFRSEEGSFLVGAAAALTSETGTVGMILGPHIDEFRAGFEAGAVHARGDIIVRTRYLLGHPFEVFTDQQQAHTAAEVLYERDADVIYTAAGIAGGGALDAAVESSSPDRHLWGIGVDVDESLFTDQGDHLLTSMLIRRDNAIRHIIGAYLDGSLEPGPLVLGLAEGAMSYSIAGDHLEPEVIAMLEQLEAEIVDGSIVVPMIPAGPATDDPEPDVVLSLVVSDGACSLGSVPALSVGDLVRIESRNETAEDAGIGLFLFEDGVTEQQVMEVGPLSLPPFFVAVTSAGPIGPGGSSANPAELFEPGTWGVSCLSGDQLQGVALFTVAPFVGENVPVADAYFAAVNAGDVETVMAMLSPDARLSNEFDGTVSRESWETVLVWDAAQGTQLTSPECRVTEEDPESGMTITCRHGTHNGMAQPVDAPPVSTTTVMRVTSDGIIELSERYGSPDFLFVGRPFAAWMQEHHPEDSDSVGFPSFGTWRSLEEARQSGVLTAQYAREWAAYLEERGCTFLDGC